MVTYLCQHYPVSERQACRWLRLNRATHRCRSHRDLRTALRQRLRDLSQTRVRYGYRKPTVLLKCEGWGVRKKLVYRLDREEGLILYYPRSLWRRKAVVT